MPPPRRDAKGTCPSCKAGPGQPHAKGCHDLTTDRRHMILHVPASLLEYEHDLHRFFDAMLYKLDQNASKGKWAYPVGIAMQKLDAEIVELRDALAQGNTVEIVLEAADVANFALIAANIAIDRGG